MGAKELFKEGRLHEAIDALGSDLRSDPTDSARRTFLFELLCFAGQWDRAEKQLDVLGQGGEAAARGTLLYRSALHAERTRQEMFAANRLPLATSPDVPASGTMNGNPFSSVTDGDPRIGPRLELFAAGQYTLMPWAHIASVTAKPPAKLRDLLWIPAIVRTGPAFKGMEIGEVLLPALAPLSSKDSDDAVRLGRMTVWKESDGEAIPVGTKLLLVDDEEFPLLEVRALEIASASGTA
ncbi:MAG: type VI secretion system accessory protein TagJ [Gemmatimonadales bacterium]